MKMTKKFAGVVLALFMLSAFVACRNADDESELKVGKIENSNSVSGIKFSDIKVASTVTYNGVEYWVTKNTFSEKTSVNASISANRSVRAAAAMKNLKAPTTEDVSYVNTYLSRDFRDKILKEETGVTKYIEMIKKGSEKTLSAKGFGVLDDVYLILDENSRQIAQFKQTWQSDSLMKYYKPELKATDARKDAFMAMSIEEIRSWDPQTVVVKYTPDSMKDWKTVELRYNYYDATVNPESEKFRKINFDDRKYRTEARECMHVMNDTKFVYKVQKYTKSSEAVNYMLLTNGKDSNSNVINLSVNTEGKGGAINVYGEGTPNGSTDASVYKKGTSFKASAIDVRSTLGENPTDGWHFTAKNDGTSVTVKKQNSSDGKNWTDAATFNESDAPSAGELFSVSKETTSIQAGSKTVTVPASITYFAHFAKNANGNYPVLDKYAKVTCYPEYDESNSKVIYKITEKSIEDYINAYKADFVQIAAGLVPSQN